MNISTNLEETLGMLRQKLQLDQNFDIVERRFTFQQRNACLYFIDGFSNSEIVNRILDSFYHFTDSALLADAKTFAQSCVAYGEVDTEADLDELILQMLSGPAILLVDGFCEGIVIKIRNYPQRQTSEPDKDKVFRGSHDGFVETLVRNTALVRRRIRTPEFCVQHLSLGDRSHTDIAICYLSTKVDRGLLDSIIKRITSTKVDALTMNQESLSEILLHRRWYNPLPKIKFTERPDTTAAQVLEGDIAILVDNSPAALIVPSTIFHIMEEANDYYFPPLTGSYLRFTRIVIMVLSVFLTPVWILLTQNPQIAPPWLEFIMVAEETSIPLVLQLLILEIAIDGLQIASLNTPNMLTTPLSIVAAIIVGDYAVQSGWFCAQTLLYEAFVTMANFSQPGFELSYCLKFMRMFLLIVTGIFGLWGLIVGTVLIFVVLLCTKSISGRGYLYPLIPFDWKILKRQLFRVKIDHQNRD